MKKENKKIKNCPLCGTPCEIKGRGDFSDNDKARTLHYEPIRKKEKKEIQDDRTNPYHRDGFIDDLGYNPFIP